MTNEKICIYVLQILITEAVAGSDLLVYEELDDLLRGTPASNQKITLESVRAAIDARLKAEGGKQAGFAQIIIDAVDNRLRGLEDVDECKNIVLGFVKNPKAIDCDGCMASIDELIRTVPAALTKFALLSLLIAAKMQPSSDPRDRVIMKLETELRKL